MSPSPPGEAATAAMKKEDDEELQTMAEKEAWLRAHGVEIETPEERRQKAADVLKLQKLQQSAASAVQEDDSSNSITRRFKYVRIPADDLQPFEQLEAIIAADAAGDILPDIVQVRFAGGGLIDERMAREQAVRQLGAKGMELSSDAIVNATAAGATETFALVRPSATNGHHGVYMYLDEVGLLKKLPVNSRAMALARACGFDSVSFYGDMFVGCVQAEPSPMRNEDFFIKDLDSSSPWLKQAGAENYEYNKSMQQLKDAMREKGGMSSMGMGDGDGGMPGGDGDGYTWSQTDDEVEVSMEVPAGTRARDVKIAFTSTAMRVTVGLAETLALPALFRRVRPDECTWTIEGGTNADPTTVVATLAKVDEEVWHQLDAMA
mmetsp:Transcript_20123/g.50151  ORF Transcript_20123/g.50151 Transcript_20123/m.50151 type:complete len:378 (-) Transcript_20123:37-1170(-)